ncbi:hypothetical protein N9Q58_03415 [Polaribacter sp.]|nr:hypothetical protein [Polaribacter sp.]|tara:strand:+ start:32 stop:247 length:216 start_codon:yes stop_codon:yes gene_type:complete
MLKERNNLDYEYFNRYLANCGSLDPSNMELINDFFKEKLNMLPEHEIEPFNVILLNELIVFCRKKQSSLKI